MKRVVLCRPMGPRNAGSALRAVTNFGPAELWVVAPALPSLLIHPDFEQMAHGVEDARDQIVVVDTLTEALADCTGAIGFTGRVRGHWILRDWREAQGEIAARCDDEGERLALVFGNEEHGLKKGELDLMQVLVRIATSPEHTSLNLAMAVTVVLASIFGGESSPNTSNRGVPLRGADRDFLKEHVKDTLAGVALSDAISREIRASAERVFSRAPLETRDASAWHAIMRALGNRSTPMDYGIEPEQER